jgi:hypothetical protein
MPNTRVHYRVVQLGRDFGATVEVLTGLRNGDTVIIHPGDDLAEGIDVQPVPRKEKQQPNAGGGQQGQTQSDSTDGSRMSGPANGGSQQGNQQQSDEEGGGGEEGSQSAGGGGSGKGPGSPGEGVPEKQTSQTR